ncbi:nucleotidyltransferase family protein [Desulfovulcanus sp.]|jgi:predicted nucleotidyltransferase
MNLLDVLDKLRKYKETHQEKFRFTRIGIFGSVARGTASEDSDIDIVIELKEPDLFFLGAIKTDLEVLFGRKVDIIRMRKKMNHFLRERIEKDAIYV